MVSNSAEKVSARNIERTQDEQDGKADDSEKKGAELDDVEECVGWVENEATKRLGDGNGGGHDKVAGKTSRHTSRGRGLLTTTGLPDGLDVADG